MHVFLYIINTLLLSMLYATLLYIDNVTDRYDDALSMIRFVLR